MLFGSRRFSGQYGAAAGFRTVALTGQVAPDTESGVTFSSFGNFVSSDFEPLINDSGQVSITSHLQCLCLATGNSGIFSEHSGSLRLAARYDSPAPGDPGLVLGPFESTAGYHQPAFNDLGQVAFVAQRLGTTAGSNNYGMWSEGSGSLNLVTRLGNSAPGAGSGATFTSLNTPLLNNLGQVAFTANTATSTTTGYGLWSQGGGVLHAVALANGAAPGMASGVKFQSISSVEFNSAGQTAFFSTLTGPGISPLEPRAIWSEGGGSLHVVAQDNTQAPGLASGTKFDEVRGFGFNDAGQLAFTALLHDSTNTQSSSLWSNTGGSFHLLGLGGTAAPGVSDGSTFLSFGRPLLNAAGRVAFTSTLDGPNITSLNDTGIWSETAGGLRLVAREGMDTPGVAGMQFFTIHPGIAVDDSGQVAFEATIGASSQTTYESIWMEGPNGLEMLARVGGQMTIGPGDIRTITNLGVGFNADAFSGGSSQNGLPKALNNHGQLVFQAQMFDQKHNTTIGVFVADVTAVPEPSSLALALASLPLLLRRRR